ncbi:hypothetical protein SAMN05216561_1292 [Nocardioides psychrotolerans]|uniref:Uncharacterized protein n=1 Tax=Nocardioides psychrotolerans TaxID=1005945 RepID=A0A1I3R0H2_9ACTN|nr:hypothetical protein [Nocardioides psychrotolerans]SFJ39635.1 hypothetical protein SAMN05216561_1292 [Nocardioides psychrotolerans]
MFEADDEVFESLAGAISTQDDILLGVHGNIQHRACVPRLPTPLLQSFRGR